jgi:RHS repeat-associated protein
VVRSPGRRGWPVLAGALVAVFLCLVISSPARADTVYAEAGNWIKYGSYQYWNGQYWYPMWGKLVDQDPNTTGTQITIANSKPIHSLQFWFPDPRQPFYPCATFAWNYHIYSTYIPPSLVPRLVTIQSANIRYLYATGANLEQRVADAARRFQAGYWVAQYQDGTTSMIPNTLAAMDPVLARVFGASAQCDYTIDPINTSSGNATYEFVDFSLPGKGLPVTFTRTYNSQAAAVSGFLGRGWRCEYQTNLEFPSASEVTFVASDGRRETFLASGNGEYTSPAGVTERLHENQDGSFTLTHLDQSALEFDPGGRLAALVDRYGNATTFTYDTSGRLATVTGAGGRSLSLTYSYAYLTQVEDNAGRTVSFTYDTGGDLVAVTDPNGHTTTYAYDAAHQLVSISEPEPSAAPFVTNTYLNGQVTMQVDALGNETALAYDLLAHETAVTDARGYTSVDVWDAGYRITSHTDPLGHSTSVVYNSAGLPASITDQNGHVTTYQYDSLGNPTSTVDPLGRETTAAYDTANGNPLWSEDAAGRRTTYLWDPTGIFLNSVVSPVGTTSFTYNPDGSLATLTDANGHTSQYGYSSYGDLISTTDPLGQVMAYEYDQAGRLVAQEDANSSRVEYIYDAKGNVVTVKDPLAEADPLDRHQIDAVYDDNDNVVEIEDANGNTTAFVYDDMNRVTQVQNALLGLTVSTYDANHNLANLEDPRGSLTTFAYDECDRLETVTDALGEVTEYGYDPVGNLTTIAFPNGNVTSFQYTADDLLSVVSYASESTTWSSSYNPTDTVSQVEKNDGKTWLFTYDAGNRLLVASDENNPYLGPLAVEWTYDDVSNVTAIDVGTANVVALSYDATDLVATLTDGGGQTSLTHDDGGRLTGIATPEGSTRSFTYDPAGRVTEVENVTGSGTQTFAYTHDANGNILSENSTTYTYDALDRLSSWYDVGSGVTTTYAYDAAGNLTGVHENGVPTESYTFNAGNEITNAGYAYDANGNLTADGTYTYTYDAANQLIEVKQGQTTLASMTYDYAGRRTSLATAAGTTYFHWASGLLVAESDGNGDITATYAYSPEGGLISMTRGEETYQTNARGDVVSLTDDTGMVVNTYSYDPWGDVLFASETVTNPMRYAGYYYDSATGLYYCWHRYYDPELRRFLTPDLVFGGSVYDPACLNGYLYVLDNPVRLSDPTGLKPKASCFQSQIRASAGFPDLFGPLEEMAQDALEWYVEKAESASWWAEGFYQIGGGLCALMTPDNGWATETILATPLVWGLAQRAGTAAEAGVCPEASSAAPSNAGTMGHIFDQPKHNMDVLVEMFGSREAAFNEVSTAALASLRAQGTTGIFTVDVQISGQIVTVTGRVMNGVARISNMWIRIP